ncbi:MAG: efflux transporter outer membrane subunit [Stagnimonas sp.]|nr:efflux transporter outer membrane subunit [Stagnimonas sp.]
MRRLAPFAASTMLGALAAGCAIGPDYQRPALDAPPHFQQSAALEERAVQGVDSNAASASWWQGFNDPVLSTIVSKALADNLDLAQVVARVSQSRAMLGAATAALLPAGELNGQSVRFHQSRRSQLGQILDASSPDFDRNGSYNEINLGASWEIDLFGGVRRAREAAMAELQAAEAGAGAARLSIATQVADTYLLVRGLQQRLRIAQQQIDASQQLVAIVKRQFDAGVVAELQLRQAEGALSQVEASVPVLEAGLEAAMNALDVALGTQPGSHRGLLTPVAPIPAAPVIAKVGSPADLLRRRPDLVVAERRLAAANARIGAAMAEYYPKFSLGGQIGSATTGTDALFTNDANQASALLGLRWRLFDFGRIDAEIDASRGRQAEALAAYKLAALHASEDVENAIVTLLRRESQTRTLSRGEIALARARSASQAAYESGVVSLVEVLDADTRLLAQRDAKAVAQMEASRAAVATFKAIGGGWNTSPAIDDASVATPGEIVAGP